MTGTVTGLFTHESVPVIFEPPCTMLYRCFLCYWLYWCYRLLCFGDVKFGIPTQRRNIGIVW